MVDRAAVALALLAPIPVLAAYQGMLTAGLLPLALFGPVYAAARYASGDTSEARTESARLAAAASLGGALALVPALLFLRQGLAPIPARLAGVGLGVTAAGLGALAGLATTPEPRPLTTEERRRWTLVETLDRPHARGLVLLLLVTVPAAIGLGLLREAPLFAGGPGPGTLPDALLGDAAVGGSLVLPDPTASVVLTIPLSLAPLALGFLTSPRQAVPIAAGGIGLVALMPLAIAFGLPVETVDGSLVPLPLRSMPGVDAIEALAPLGAGLLLGAGAVHVGRHVAKTRLVRRSLWAATGALVVFLLDGLLPASLLLVGVLVAALVVSWRTRRAPLGGALAVGALLGLGVGATGAAAEGMALGALTGIVAGGAAITSSTARSLLLPEESVRSPRTLVYLLIGLSLGGAVAWAAGTTLASGSSPFAAPHARGLAAALEALVTSRGDLLVLWGLAAGVLIQLNVDRGILVGLGFLAGPGVALMILFGSLLRAAWESRLLERAREGFVMRGELGYELLRIHVIVIAILAGEAVAVALGPLLR